MVSTDTGDTFADGVATRTPDPTAFEMIRHGADRIVTVSEDEIADAMRAYYTDTHNLAEGAGAAPLAALLRSARRCGAGRSASSCRAGTSTWRFSAGS